MGDIGTLKFDNPEREKQRQDSESELHRRSAWLPAQIKPELLLKDHSHDVAALGDLRQRPPLRDP
jgi:hypothetical protein